MIRKLLIANRGEIAVRVVRACREMGVRTVAVYSDADEKSMHVALADEAVHIGGSEPSASYLNGQTIIDAAKATSADAIHPGYGFLSERADFAEACDKAGIVFVGPPASAMRKLGAKIDAKQLAVSVGVPVTPGFFELGASPQQLKAAADQIGYPVMLKASAGGGGRGMRVVRQPEDFDAELSMASDEALKGFGDGAMMVEKLVERPRHIEVQVLADQYGNVACLFERECSLQRRHQKIIEEAPGALPREFIETLWPQMRTAVEKLVRASGYVGAGTAEFMVDITSGEFYFLEVNARLQVEHPVTELVTGLDLVQWQLRVASGEALRFSDELMKGDRSALAGHAIEARIVAEDPAAGFMPSIGKILAWAEPKAPGVRVDSGFGPGSEVTRYYDSLIAKVIAHGATRAEAVSKLRAALMDFHVIGVKTNLAYLLEVIGHPEFLAGDIDTGFLGREFSDWSEGGGIPMELGAIAEFGGSSSAEDESHLKSNIKSAWNLDDSFRIVR